MELHTTRFGTINIEAEDIITFPDGLVGLSQLKQFVLVNHQDGSPFRWLQSADDPGFALLLIDPWFFCVDYEVILSDAEIERLRVSEGSVLVVYTTVTIPHGRPHAMTANLLAPIVINASERCGRQVILEDDRYHTRHPILQEMWRSVEQTETAG